MKHVLRHTRSYDSTDSRTGWEAGTAHLPSSCVYTKEPAPEVDGGRRSKARDSGAGTCPAPRAWARHRETPTSTAACRQRAPLIPTLQRRGRPRINNAAAGQESTTPRPAKTQQCRPPRPGRPRDSHAAADRKATTPAAAPPGHSRGNHAGAFQESTVLCGPPRPGPFPG